MTTLNVKHKQVERREQEENFCVTDHDKSQNTYAFMQSTLTLLMYTNML